MSDVPVPPPPPPPPMLSGQPESSINADAAAAASSAAAPTSNGTNQVLQQQLPPQQVVPAPPIQTGIIPPPPPPPPPSQSSSDVPSSSISTMKVPRKSHTNNSSTNSSSQNSSSLVSTISKTVYKKNNNNHYSNNNDVSGVKKILPPLNLPPGVTLPPTMDPTVLQSSGRALALLNDLSPSQVQAALNEFDEAIRNKGDKVRNVQAYLVGVIRRYLHVNRKERSAVGAPIMGNDITPVVKVTIQKLIDSNFCTQADIGNNVLSKLKMLSEHDALLAINEISSVPRATIRNFSSYFMGILNRYMRGEETPQKHRNGRQPTMPRGVSNYGGRGGAVAGVHMVSGVPNQYNNKDLRKDRRGDPRRSRRKGDDRYSDRHRRSRSYESDYSDDRSTGRSRRSRRSRRRDESDDSDYSRSPSSDRDYRSRRRRDRDRSRSSTPDRHRDKYDRRRYRSRSRSRSRSPYNKRRDRDSNRTSSRRSGDTNSAAANKSALPIPTGSVPPFAGGAIPPPPPPPPRQDQPLQWPNTNPTTSAYGQPPPIAPPAPSHVVPPYQNAQFKPNPYGQVGAPAPTNTSNLDDILGIAEKAASAVQALHNSQSLMGGVRPNNVMTGTYYPPAPAGNPYQHQEEKLVKITDLTPMIQYSITNLRATGMLDKELGENACRLLKKMHESVALQALEKFSSCDGSKMRSKEGYLIGILRKASER